MRKYSEVFVDTGRENYPCLFFQDVILNTDMLSGHMSIIEFWHEKNISGELLIWR